jgi:hypothetical protein
MVPKYAVNPTVAEPRKFSARPYCVSVMCSLYRQAA